MKKFIFSTLFMIGMLFSAQAQIQLDYHIENWSNTESWTYGIAEANGSNVSGTLGPNGTASGTVTFFGNFPVQWRVYNNNTGCGYNNTEPTAVPETNIPFTCGASGVYKIEQIGFNHYIFKMGLD